MRYTEIQQGICINPDLVEAIVEIEGDKCEVYIGGRKFLANYNYDTLKAILRKDSAIDSSFTKSEQFEKTVKKLDGVLGTVSHFAG